MSPLFTPATGMQDIPTPRALTTEVVHQTVADFGTARGYIDYAVLSA